MDNLSGTRTFEGWRVTKSSYMDKDGTIVETTDSTWISTFKVNFRKLDDSSVFCTFAPLYSVSIFNFIDKCQEGIHDGEWEHYNHYYNNSFATIHYHPANNTPRLFGAHAGKGPYGNTTSEYYWEN